MTFLLLAIILISGIVSCAPLFSSEGIPPQMNELITNISVNVTINTQTGTNSNFYNISFKDVEDIINGSGHEYLDTLLINTHIGHKLDFDLIEEKSKNKLIVYFHVTLTGDTITNNTNDNNININDLQTNIQVNSDNKLGKNVLNIKLNHDPTLTTLNPITTNEKYIDSIMDHHEHMSILLLLMILIIITLFTFCIGCIVIIFYLKRIRNEQKQNLQKINSNSTIKDNINIKINDNINASDNGNNLDNNVQNIVINNVEIGTECEILVTNNVNNCIGEDSYAMTDSEQLYKNTNVIIPGAVDDNTIGNSCTTPY